MSFYTNFTLCSICLLFLVYICAIWYAPCVFSTPLVVVPTVLRLRHNICFWKIMQGVRNFCTLSPRTIKTYRHGFYGFYGFVAFCVEFLLDFCCVFVVFYGFVIFIQFLLGFVVFFFCFSQFFASIVHLYLHNFMGVLSSCLRLSGCLCWTFQIVIPP